MTPSDLAYRYRTLALDGCDGTGKTTLATRLAAQHGFTVVHSPRTPDGIDITTRYLQILATPGPIVLDRCFVSELVYGPLRHGHSRITLHDAVHLARAVADRDGALLHLTGPPETVHARLRSRDGNTATSLAEIATLVTTYERVFTQIAAHLPGRVIRIDITDMPPEPVAP